MKRIIVLLLVLTGMLSQKANLFASDEFDGGKIIAYLVPYMGGADEVEFPEIGHRIPSKRILCSINVLEKTIDFSPLLSEDPILYEVWTEDLSYCISSVDNVTEFINLLATIGSNYAIIICCPDVQYVGYI